MSGITKEQLTYDSYKDSGVDWLGDIPEEWNIIPGFRVFSENKRINKGMIEDTVLSLSYGKIIVKPKEKLIGLVPESFETYQIVEKGDVIIRCTDLQNDQTSLRTGLAKNRGIITSAYLNLKINEQFEPRFVHYYLHSLDTTKAIYKLGSGLRQNLNFIDFKRFPFLDINFSLQVSIANFLDKKNAQIDEAIAIKQKQIELLKERKQIIIQQAVTQGLDPNVPMKESGVDWIGEIPEYWEVKKAKYIFKKMSRPIRKEDEVITCFRDGEVTLRSNRRTEGFTFAMKEHGYQGIRCGDLVIHAMDAFAGAIGVSDSNGKSSPVYSACKPIEPNSVNPKYYALFLRNLALNGFIESLAKGIRERSTDFRFKDFAELYLPLPDTYEQGGIVEYIESEHKKIDSAIVHLYSQIEKLKEYKTTLINSAVTGKVKVTE
ncbi:restriction endonuclease subunit S [Photobacterium leiognathi]|uniref:restriction endonuclease subunit S n=1 Tax=Photobacterium leiognathi TaxID=553611 RepID=UPI00273A238E|nr:restriction endonuclease subunit S [Photobacterium leiognathi]